jgi:hypothetical protein
LRIQFAEYLELLRLTIQDSNWRQLHQGLRFNWARVRELKDIVDHIYHEMYLKDKWNRDNDNDRLLVAHVKDNLNFWTEFSKITSIEFCKRGYPTKHDLNTVLEMFIRGESLKLELEPLDLDNDILKYLADSFKRFTDTSKENAKFNTLEKAFGVANYKGQKTNAKNPFKVPRWIMTICKNLLEQNQSLTKQWDSKAVPISETVAKREWSLHKWQVLNEYLYKLCLKGKGKATLTTTQIETIKRNWNKVVFPKDLILEMRPDIPRLSVKDKGVQVIKASDTIH